MADASSAGLPGWIYKRDGRLVPFEADKISQALFAATEDLGRGNAFLARELTESVLHFLAQEFTDATPASAHVAELVVKVVRELGQPALAQAYSQRHLATKPSRETAEKTRGQSIAVPFSPGPEPHKFLDQCARLYSLKAVFSRDLAAAQEEGWLTLLGLSHPAVLEGGVLDWPGREGRSLLAALLEGRQRFGGFIALDGPEFALEPGPGKNRHVALFVRDLREGLDATRLRALVNLNVAQPPPWAWQPPESLLFRAGQADAPEEREALLDSLLEALLDEFPPGDLVRLDWHLGDRDFASPHGKERLTLMLRRALEDPQVSFVFDRPDRPVALAEGLDREHQAVLQVAGLHLAPLVDMPGVEGDADRLLQKLANLGRMAASAGTQKRQFLRQLKTQPPGMRRGFLLDRARLVAIVVGLPAVVFRLTGQSIAGKLGLGLAREILERLRQCFHEINRSANLDAVLDNPWWTARTDGTGALFSAPHLVGLTCGDLTAPPDDQLRAAGSLHHITRAGTATILLPSGPPPSLDFLANLVQAAWKKTDLVRLRLHRLPAPAQEPPDLLPSP